MMACAVYNVNVKANFVFNININFNFTNEGPLAFVPLGTPDRLCANSEKLRDLGQGPQLLVAHLAHLGLLGGG